jgi:hypothetical protein
MSISGIKVGAHEITLGNAANAKVRRSCGARRAAIRSSLMLPQMAERYGANTAVPEWRERLVCSACGSRNVDMVVTGTERR